MLELADEGATFLLNSPYGPDQVWERLPAEVQRQIVDKRLRFFIVDAGSVAREAGLGSRVNTVLQPCFFALAGVLPRDQAIEAIKHAIEKTYGKRGRVVVERNFRAVDLALGAMHEIELPAEATGTVFRRPPVPADAPDFVRRVTSEILAGRGDRLPVSALPADGTFPVGTARYEKRSLAEEIPVWDPDICIDCAKCALVCPHAAIRLKVFDADALAGAPAGFKWKEWRGRDLPGKLLSVQVAPDDCTGCGICIDTCPARSKEVAKHKSLDAAPRLEHLDEERANWDFFLSIPELDRTLVEPATVKGSQLLEPLFEFSGACEGCGETPYLKLLTQLYGDRILVANATGCSSIYGGNLPTTPWSANAEGRGPAWANSLFEDNAEFGLGMRLALDHQSAQARALLTALEPTVDPELAEAILGADDSSEAGINAQRTRVAELKAQLAAIDTPEARRLSVLADALVRKSVWIVGGDGWAYDIGSGGLDHVLASGRDVNVLVLDTEVYSNTGGQASKATPLGAVAKFAAAGKRTRKKDLGQIAAAYGTVYVAQVALGADNPQTVKAFAEANAYPGPSLILAYSHCIAHGIEMSTAMAHQKEATDSGYWPLYRYDPRLDHPFQLDSRKPKLPLAEFTGKEARFAMLARARPEEAEQLSRAGPARRRRALAPLRTARRRRHTPHCRRRTNERRPSHPLPGTRARQPDRPLGLAARRRPGDLEAARGRRRRGRRAAVAVRGADRARGDRPAPGARDRTRELRRGDYLLPGARRLQHGPGHLSRSSRGREGRALDPGDRQPQRQLPRRLGPIRTTRSNRPARTRSSSTSTRSRPTPPKRPQTVETRILDTVRAVRAEVQIPLAVKIGPFFTALAHLATRLVVAGANGLVLFNRFVQPDIDLETMSVLPQVQLSSREELLLPLRWIAILYGRMPDLARSHERDPRRRGCASKRCSRART